METLDQLEQIDALTAEVMILKARIEDASDVLPDHIRGEVKLAAEDLASALMRLAAAYDAAEAAA